jgi:hypothetical protein
MEADRGTVLIVTDRLRGPVIEDVADACRAADVRPVCWPPGDQRTVARPSLVVGGLRPGERRIPPAMLSVAASAPDNPPLLLLCDEPLVRSTVSLHDGRVVLVEQPAARARLYSAVRVLLTSRGDAEPYTARGSTRPGIRARCRSRVWLAEIPGASAPPIVIENDTNVTTIVPFEVLAEGIAEAAARAISEVRPEDRAGETLSDLLGGRAGIVHLDARSNEWVFWWPRKDAPLWVSSTRRLPNFFPLHTSSGTSVVRLAASHGDVAAALAVAPAADDLAVLGPAMITGGPTFVDALLARPVEDIAGCVMEVR